MWKRKRKKKESICTQTCEYLCKLGAKLGIAFRAHVKTVCFPELRPMWSHRNCTYISA